MICSDLSDLWNLTHKPWALHTAVTSSNLMTSVYFIAHSYVCVCVGGVCFH